MGELLRLDSPADVRLLERDFAPADPLNDFARIHPSSGAIASFVGQVRAEQGVQALELTHYEPLTLPGMRDLAAGARHRFGLDGVLAWHRVGVMQPGAAIVLVAAAAPHRRDAFAAVDYLMDHLKSAAWFWKREQTKEGWRWIEPRAQDRTDLERWN